MQTPRRVIASLAGALTLAAVPASSAMASRPPDPGEPYCGSPCYLTSRLVMVTKDTAQSYVTLHNTSSKTWCFYWDKYIIGTGHHYNTTKVGAHSAPELFEGYWPVVPPAYSLISTYAC